MNETTTQPTAKKSASEALQIAETIFSQLGGTGRLKMFTGAKNFAYSAKDNGDVEATFRIGKNAAGINHVSITLNGLDLYDVTFRRIHGTKVTVKAEAASIYGDMLVAEFESSTGMFLSF